MPASRIVRPLIASISLGILGFIAGYFGPLYLNPTGNQGPLLGMFAGAPAGLMLGLVLGVAMMRAGRGAFVAAVGIAAVAVVAGVLFLSLPEDRLEVQVVEGTVTQCAAPAAFVDAAAAKWSSSGDQEPVRGSSWRDQIPAMLARDRGVVVTLRVEHRWSIWRQRKLWNANALRATTSPGNSTENFFMRNVDCAEPAVQAGRRVESAAQWEVSSVSPPDLLPTFLGLHVLRPVPETFRPLVAAVKGSGT
jgi:hypothetical protein